MHKRRRISGDGAAGRIARLLDIPADAVPGGMELEIKNDSDIFVGGCGSISEYSDERVVFSGKRMTIVITGIGFELYTFADGRVRISGKVKFVEIRRDGDNA